MKSSTESFGEELTIGKVYNHILLEYLKFGALG